MNLVRRTALIAIAVAIIVGFGAAAYLLVPWKGDSADAASGAPKLRPTGNGRFELVAFPPGRRDRHPAGFDDPGRREERSDQAPHGQGTRRRRRSAATSTPPERGGWPRPGSRSARRTRSPHSVVPEPGESTHRALDVHDARRPTGDLGARVVPGDNEVVGVGQPISVRFTQPVANKAAVEARLNVTTSVPVDGSWHWMSDREVHWRPVDYWPANTEVLFDADLTGVDAGNGVIGNVHRTAHFRIGASHVEHRERDDPHR